MPSQASKAFSLIARKHLLVQNSRIGHISHNDTILEDFVSKYPIFLKNGTMVSHRPPFFEPAQRVISQTTQMHQKAVDPFRTFLCCFTGKFQLIKKIISQF